jgi:hypothetical protein
MSESALDRLIDVGRSGDFDRLKLLFSPYEQNDHPSLASDHASWLLIIESLNSDDLVSIIKALTIGELEFTGWKSGSVSPVIRLFRKLCEIDPNQADIVAKWVLKHTANPYLPWGTMLTRAESLAEFHEFERGQWERHLERKAEDKRQEEARQRNAQKRSRNLFVAINSNDVKAVKALISRGVYDKDLVVDGMTAIELAEKLGNSEIIELLRAAGDSR